MIARSPRAMVREFIVAFEASRDPKLWIKLIEEEVAEFKKAVLACVVTTDRADLRVAAAEVIKEAVDVSYVWNGFLLLVEEYDGVVELDEELYLKVQAVADFMKEVCPIETFVIAFERVHASNMSKLGADGKPVRRDDGKILKGPNYAPPHLMDLINE